MKLRDYQRNFARTHPAMYDQAGREQKANTMIAVLADALGDKLPATRCINIGCSTGIIDNYLAPHVGNLIGIDIDVNAVEHANANNKWSNLSFQVGDAMALNFSDASCAVVLCSQVYEHVPDPGQMMREIYRILAPGGVCYFAATNKLCVVEQHYFLPFLSMLPRPLADLYLRMTGKGNHYYEQHMTYRELSRLTAAFDTIDYTERLIREPIRFHTAYLFGKRGLKAYLLLEWIRFAYWSFPGYIWLLRKRDA